MTIFGWILIVCGLAILLGLWLNNGMHDKMLGWAQFVGWPMVGVAIALLGLVLLIFR